MEMSVLADSPARRDHACTFEGPAGIIQAVISQEFHSRGHGAAAIVCHPHPLHGGSLHNKVTRTLARALAERGAATVRFNFRGVGESAGCHNDGVGETDDLLAVIEQTRARYPDRELWLAGFSFGAYVALRAAQITSIDRLVTVAPPVNFYDFTELHIPACPWLLLHGTDDELVPFKDVLKWSSRLYPAPQTLYLDGVGHYFHGRLNTLRTALLDCLPAESVPARSLT